MGSEKLTLHLELVRPPDDASAAVCVKTFESVMHEARKIGVAFLNGHVSGQEASEQINALLVKPETA